MFKKRKVAKAAGRSVQGEEDELSDQAEAVKAPVAKAARVDTVFSQPPAPSDTEPNCDELEVKKAAEVKPAGTYKGLKKTNRYGPIAASKSIRSTVVTDYQPDVCKDYKQTGYCGYGDSCKFLHIREDYAAGWQLDDAKPKPQPAHKVQTAQPTRQPDETKCGICSRPLNTPVKTRCGHFFCEECFLARNKKTASCAVCGKNTDGIIKRVK
ncbi:Pre-mRNA-splicing factor CWC24 [Wickerhamiella sorbophila]|uniref:Pre-mRNA-splicing factor CWC24 n=1 Tax=Wickerhamiella sorbophila TaxID=45607 RepID=A0A2T0FJD6_9ASCO|nr:Pre-mRNA-splicing factor CWC24 [Wickerhamiella sorbophila]PRT55085.1 Pre-mRNA-splicing factor CWC24 [Wickerhamiella sorbophila]